MANETLHIHPRVIDAADTVRYEFDLAYSGGSRVETVFYEVARETAPPPLDNFDGILCATVLHAMGQRRNIRLHGPATSEILRNLTEFQLAWRRWRPDVYQPVEIEADSVTIPRLRDERSLSAFSGGVDSTFTLLRNNPQSPTPRYGIDTVVLVHGFDVSLANSDALRELVDRTEPVRALTGARLCIVRTNSKELASAELGGLLRRTARRVSAPVLGRVLARADRRVRRLPRALAALGDQPGHRPSALGRTDGDRPRRRRVLSHRQDRLPRGRAGRASIVEGVLAGRSTRGATAASARSA